MIYRHLLSCILLVIAVSCTNNNGTTKQLTVGVTRRPSNALICLADKEIERRGRDRTWKLVYVDRTDLTLVALDKKEIDIAVAAPPTFFKFAIKKPQDSLNYRVIAGINNIQNSFVVIALKTSGIKQAQDIRLKKLGHLGEITDFFKNYFFLTEGINEAKIQQFLFQEPALLLKAVESRKIDAAIVPDDIARRIDPTIYNLFYSKVHEITSQVITRKETIVKNRAALHDLLEGMVNVEKDLYSDKETSLEKLKQCYPDAHEATLKDLLERQELRVLMDESLRAQYALYKKWIITKPELRSSVPFIRSFDLRTYVDSSILNEIDFRRVLMR